VATASPSKTFRSAALLSFTLLACGAGSSTGAGESRGSSGSNTGIASRPRAVLGLRVWLECAALLAFLVLQGCGGRVCSPSAYVGYVGSDALSVYTISGAELERNGEAYDGKRVRVRGRMTEDGMILFLDGRPASIDGRVIDLDVLWNIGHKCRRQLAGRQVEIDARLTFIGFQWRGMMPVGYLTDVSRLVVL